MTRALASISVAIATLDRPLSLARCLDALLGGEVLPAEIIVTDQSENDATCEVVEQRAGSAVSIIYLRQPRRGLSASRNQSFAHAKCRVVAITDDDCVPASNWISAINAALSSQDSPNAITGSVAPLGPANVDSYDVSPRSGIIPREFRGKVAPWYVGTGGNFAVFRSWFEQVGGYDEQLGAGSPGKAAEDADIMYRLLLAGARIRYEPNMVVYHERQSRERRMATRWSYGYGIGAFCGKVLRRGDPYAVRMFGEWFWHQSRALARAIIRCDMMLARQRLLSLSGAVQGVVYGAGIRGSWRGTSTR